MLEAVLAGAHTRLPLGAHTVQKAAFHTMESAWAAQICGGGIPLSFFLILGKEYRVFLCFQNSPDTVG